MDSYGYENWELNQISWVYTCVKGSYSIKGRSKSYAKYLFNMHKNTLK